MKALCPITGVPYRTYDNIPLMVPYKHPIFSLSYEQLIYLMDKVRDLEESEIKNIENYNKQQLEFQEELGKFKTITSEVMQAIHEKNWKNTAFRLYQTKHLVLLAFMDMAGLLEVEKGYCARPKPLIIEAYFWPGISLFAWACAIRNPQMLDSLPKYRISEHNEDMGNFKEYIEILSEVKDSLGAKYRSRSDEHKIVALQHAIAILAKRKDTYKREIDSGNNRLIATWALMVARAPKDVYPFWFEILSSKSTKITFEGVYLNGKLEVVHGSDLRELRDFLEDNLIAPRGDAKQTHEDDSEYYFIARQQALSIVRKHLAILEQGTAGYQIVNAAINGDILSASDDELEIKAKESGLAGKPLFIDYKTKLEFIRAIAKWRTNTKSKLLDIANLALPKEIAKKEISYEIL